MLISTTWVRVTSVLLETSRRNTIDVQCNEADHLFCLSSIMTTCTQDLLCGACKAKSRRLSKYLGVDVITLNTPAVELPAAAGSNKKGGGATVGRGNNGINGTGRPRGSGEGEGDEEDGKPWKFRCKCGDVCSSYEKEIYHPGGQWYECSQCAVWSHVVCNLGNVTPAQIVEMKVRL